MQGTMTGARRRGRPRTAWMDNIKTWTGLSVVRPTLGSRTAKEQNRTIDTQHQIRQRAYTIRTQGGRVSSSSSSGNNLLHVQTERGGREDGPGGRYRLATRRRVLHGVTLNHPPSRATDQQASSRHGCVSYSSRRHASRINTIRHTHTHTHTRCLWSWGSNSHLPPRLYLHDLFQSIYGAAHAGKYSGGGGRDQRPRCCLPRRGARGPWTDAGNQAF